MSGVQTEPNFLLYFFQTLSPKSSMDEVRRGLYADNDIEIRDLFCKVSSGGLKFTLGHHTSIGKILQGIRHSETRIGDSYLADVKTQLKCEISDNIHSRVFATMISEPIPGMKTIFNFIIPDCNFGKVELQYQNMFVGISSSLRLTQMPVVDFSCMLGREDLSIGTNVSFNPATRKLTECKYGLRSTMPGYIFSCSLNTKNDIVTGSLYHLVRSSTCTALGYQFTSNISTFQSKLTVGIQHAMDPLTKVKGCVDNFGTVSATVQKCEWDLWPKSFFTISGEVNVLSILKSAKIGLSLAFYP